MSDTKNAVKVVVRSTLRHFSYSSIIFTNLFISIGYFYVAMSLTLLHLHYPIHILGLLYSQHLFHLADGCIVYNPDDQDK